MKIWGKIDENFEKKILQTFKLNVKFKFHFENFLKKFWKILKKFETNFETKFHKISWKLIVITYYSDVN